MLIQFGNIFCIYIILEYANIVLTLNGNGTKLHHRGFSLDIRKSLFTMRVVKHWNRLPGKVVDAQCLSLFKRELSSSYQ